MRHLYRHLPSDGEIMSGNGRTSYKIFASKDQLQEYLKRNKDKICKNMAPAFAVEEYKEYENTQVRKLLPAEIDKYMLERELLVH